MLEIFEPLRSLTMLSLLLRFFMAFLFGGLIGLERGRRQQAAGLRTHMMVCIGAASTMMVSEYMALTIGGDAKMDVMRLSAQVISGIGFLGAGSIIVTKQNRIRGLTTAASLWASACMGILIGSGFYEGALAMMVMMLFILLILSEFDIKYVKTAAYISIFVELEEGCTFSPVLSNLRSQGWNIQEIRELSFLTGEHLSLRIDLLSDEKRKSPGLELDEIRSIEKVHFVEKM